MATTTNFGWETPDDTDLVKDGAAAIRTALGGVDTSFVDLKGGTTGQVLSKASNTDLDFSWVAIDPLTILDAKGDLITATAADTPARLASSGVNGNVLTVDTSTSTGLKWAAPAGGGGKILQVVQTTKTNTFTTSSASATAITGLDVTITPSSTSSKILVMTFLSLSSDTGQGFPVFYLQRGSTQILIGDAGAGNQRRVTTGVAPTNNNYLSNAAMTYLDSPSSTSALTYGVYVSTADSSGSIAINRTIVDSNVNYNARGTSTIIVMEVGA